MSASISARVIVTASITNEALDDLAHKTGEAADAVVEALDVMVPKQDRPR